MRLHIANASFAKFQCSVESVNFSFLIMELPNERLRVHPVQ